ncbi:MAG TPA: sensor histidine kinase [Ktedonobacterales bacterium]|jgi:signal transduction histidine kinase
MSQQQTLSSTLERLHQRQHWTVWLIAKPFDLVFTPLYLAVPFLYIYFSAYCGCGFSWQRVLEMSGAILVLLYIERAEYWRYREATPRNIAVFLLLVRVLLIEVVAELDHFVYSPFLYLVIPFTASLYFGSLVSYGLAGLAWVTYITKETLYNSIWFHQANDVHDMIIYSLGLLFAITMANTVNKERASRARAERLLAELEVTHEQLKASAEQATELATTKERNRLARDIHDSLGHYLTVINVQLEKALAFRSKKPEDADQAVGTSKQLASEALQEIRRSVGALRAQEDGFSLQHSLRELIERMQSSHLSITLTMEGQEEDFSRRALIALYRAAQEGLTNIQKHAHASQITVALHLENQQATLRVCDNGRGFDTAMLLQLQPGREGRYGLQGVQERLEQVQGSLQVESMPGSGTCLAASVPALAPLMLPDASENGMLQRQRPEQAGEHV